MQWYKFFRNGEIIGGDASENGDFQKGKQRLQGVQIFQGPTLAGVVDEYMKFSGGDLVENDYFQKLKLANDRGNFQLKIGDDATENVNFQRRKQRLQGAKISG